MRLSCGSPFLFLAAAIQIATVFVDYSRMSDFYFSVAAIYCCSRKATLGPHQVGSVALRVDAVVPLHLREPRYNWYSCLRTTRIVLG